MPNKYNLKTEQYILSLTRILLTFMVFRLFLLLRIPLSLLLSSADFPDVTSILDSSVLFTVTERA